MEKGNLLICFCSDFYQVYLGSKQGTSANKSNEEIGNERLCNVHHILQFDSFTTLVATQGIYALLVKILVYN